MEGITRETPFIQLERQGLSINAYLKDYGNKQTPYMDKLHN